MTTIVTASDGHGAFPMCTYRAKHVTYILSFTSKSFVRLMLSSQFYRWRNWGSYKLGNLWAKITHLPTWVFLTPNHMLSSITGRCSPSNRRPWEPPDGKPWHKQLPLYLSIPFLRTRSNLQFCVASCVCAGWDKVCENWGLWIHVESSINVEPTCFWASQSWSELGCPSG